MIDINPHAFSPTKVRSSLARSPDRSNHLAQKEPYNPSSFKPARSKASSSKAPVVPIRGAASILSFFSVLPAPKASGSRVRMVDSKSVKGKGKARDEEKPVVEVASKFFGRGKEVENVCVEEEEDDDEFSDDEAYSDEEDRRSDEEDLDAEAELDDLMDLDDPPPPLAANDLPSLPAKREASIISSYAGISSPATTPPRKRRRIEEDDARTDDGISSPSEKTLFAESMSSPAPTPIKEERSEAGLKTAREQSSESDPIAWSEPITPDKDEVECTPRGKGKGRAKETPVPRIKKEKRSAEEEEEEPVEAVASVAANWRAKFMAPSSSVKVRSPSPLFGSPNVLVADSPTSPLRRPPLPPHSQHDLLPPQTLLPPSPRAQAQYSQTPLVHSHRPSILPRSPFAQDEQPPLALDGPRSFLVTAGQGGAGTFLLGTEGTRRDHEPQVAGVQVWWTQACGSLRRKRGHLHLVVRFILRCIASHHFPRSREWIDQAGFKVQGCSGDRCCWTLSGKIVPGTRSYNGDRGRREGVCRHSVGV